MSMKFDTVNMFQDVVHFHNPLPLQPPVSSSQKNSSDETTVR